MTPARTYTVRSQRLDLHVSEWGDHQAPPLLLIHGGRDHGLSWTGVASELATTWRVIAPDLRGHGDSGWIVDGIYDVTDHLVDLATLVDIIGLHPVTIVGHSYGGNIGLRYAACYPERVHRLVVIEGLGYSPNRTAEIEAQSPALRLRDWVESVRAAEARSLRRYSDQSEAAQRLAEAHPRLPADTARQLALDSLRDVGGGQWSFKTDPAFGVVSPADLSTNEKHALWRSVECPVLLIYGSESWASNPAMDGRATHFRQARVALIEGAGHWVHLEQPKLFMAELRVFLGEKP